LDTLAGGFAAGLKPTGNKDPFALRRNALALARTIIERKLEIMIFQQIFQSRMEIWFTQAALSGKIAEDALKEAIDKIRAAGGNTDAFNYENALPFSIDNLPYRDDSSEIFDFVVDRLRAYYSDQGSTSQQFESVAADLYDHESADLNDGHPVVNDSLLDFDRRLKAIGEFAKLPEAEALAAANKRIRNILKKSAGGIVDTVNPALFAEDAERDLHAAVEQAIADTDDALKTRDYVAVLGRLARLRPVVDTFFEKVMVNADDPAVRGNRLALLQRLADRLGSVAAIEHLSI
jgi:glycyl-tRNA synthetase beta chain